MKSKIDVCPIFIGTWSQVLKQLCVDPASQGSFKRLTTKDLIAEIKSWSARHGAINHSKLIQTDRLLARRIANRFGSLEKGARECDVPFQKRAIRSGKTKKWTKELVLKEIKGLRDLKAVSATQPALYGAAARLFGSWKKALEASKRLDAPMA